MARSLEGTTMHGTQEASAALSLSLAARQQEFVLIMKEPRNREGVDCAEIRLDVAWSAPRARAHGPVVLQHPLFHEREVAEVAPDLVTGKHDLDLAARANIATATTNAYDKLARFTLDAHQALVLAPHALPTAKSRVRVQHTRRPHRLARTRTHHFCHRPAVWVGPAVLRAAAPRSWQRRFNVRHALVAVAEAARGARELLVQLRHGRVLPDGAWPTQTN